eukprot:gb/GEZJ01006422.1/.p1 GENE.gb/GEZJ01006422.1/~~gb/GEZJ01006422.1/.p1  ORF type:complete len:106 (+),score=11.08 gb/GEZJ01006422.1/:124-441(+)
MSEALLRSFWRDERYPTRTRLSCLSYCFCRKALGAKSVVMDKDHDHPNTAFRDTEHCKAWIEIYHSRPSWKISQISFKKDFDEWVPFGKFQLLVFPSIKNSPSQQ